MVGNWLHLNGYPACTKNNNIHAKSHTGHFRALLFTNCVSSQSLVMNATQAFDVHKAEKYKINVRHNQILFVYTT